MIGTFLESFDKATASIAAGPTGDLGGSDVEHAGILKVLRPSTRWHPSARDDLGHVQG